MIFVLWGLSVSTVLVSFFIVATRSQVVAAGTHLAQAQAGEIVYSGIMLQLAKLMTPEAGQIRGATQKSIFPDADLESVCAWNDTFSLTLHASAERGKIDLNTSSAEILETFFSRIIPEASRSKAVVNKIFELRKSAGTNNKAFSTIYDLDSLLSDAISFERVKAFLTVHSSSAGIDPLYASSSLLRLLLNGLKENANRQEIISAFPQRLSAISPNNVVLISALAVSRSGLRYPSEAIIDMSVKNSDGYRILEWRDHAASNPKPYKKVQEADCLNVH